MVVWGAVRPRDERGGCRADHITNHDDCRSDDNYYGNVYNDNRGGHNDDRRVHNHHHVNDYDHRVGAE
jgi:hypothetical protein